SAPSLWLTAAGEYRSSWLGSKPTRALPAEVADTVNPPLSATPGGVTSRHVAAVGARKKSAQKVFSVWPRSPMATTAREPPWEERALAVGARSVGVVVPAAASPSPTNA